MTAMGNDNYVQSAVRAGQDGYMKVDGRKLGVRTLTHSRSHVFFFLHCHYRYNPLSTESERESVL